MTAKERGSWFLWGTLLLIAAGATSSRAQAPSTLGTASNLPLSVDTFVQSRAQDADGDRAGRSPPPKKGLPFPKPSPEPPPPVKTPTKPVPPPLQQAPPTVDAASPSPAPAEAPSSAPLTFPPHRAPMPGQPHQPFGPGYVPEPITGWGPALPGREPLLYAVPPQVADTMRPDLSDGLQENRQVALSPFPNLNLQSGPLGVEQLPWYQKDFRDPPYSVLETIAFQSMIGFMQMNTSLPSRKPFGWWNSAQVGFPILREYKIGGQLGVAVEGTTFPQLIIETTAGFYHRAIWPDEVLHRLRAWRRTSWGIVYDGYYDQENRFFVGQIRSQITYALTPTSEAGVWFALPLNEEFVPSDGLGQPATFAASASFDFFYRKIFRNDIDATLFMGATENPGKFTIGLYTAYRFSQQTSLIFSTLLNNDPQGPFSVYAGLEFYPWPTSATASISGNPDNRYRPFQRVADHVNFQVRSFAR